MSKQLNVDCCVHCAGADNVGTECHWQPGRDIHELRISSGLVHGVTFFMDLDQLIAHAKAVNDYLASLKQMNRRQLDDARL